MFERVDYVMVIVSDMARSIRFCRDQIGLALKFESPEWTEFQTGTTTLALHGGGTPPPPSKSAGQGQSAGACSIGFTVEDVEKTFAALQSKGVPFILPPSQREGEDIKLAVASDPDGLPISFAERVKKR